MKNKNTLPLKIGLLGGTGRMGQELQKEILGHTNLSLAGIYSRKESDDGGEGNFLSLQDVFERSDVVIDFSHGASFNNHLESAVLKRKPYFVGTTGLTSEQLSLAKQASEKIPLLQANNTSLGIALLSKYVEDMGHYLDESYDIEIVESHHRQKVDAPSGTAYSLAQAAARGRGKDLHDILCLDRSHQARPHGSIGISSIRGGQVVGKHSVCFMGADEHLVLQHECFNRSVFAKGAIKGAVWLSKQSVGFYGMKDLFSF